MVPESVLYTVESRHVAGADRAMNNDAIRLVLVNVSDRAR